MRTVFDANGCTEEGWPHLSLRITGWRVLTVLVIYGLSSEFPLVMLRWVLGSVFVLIIPSYVTVEAFFPKGRDLDRIERFALSVGLSLSLVPLVGLLLKYAPWGIRLTPIMISLVAFTIEGLFGRARSAVPAEHGEGRSGTDPGLNLVVACGN